MNSDFKYMVESVEQHAARAGLPRITEANAGDYHPQSLNGFRTAASRAANDSLPVLWFWQMTGEEWDRDSKTYGLAAKKHWRMLPENQEEKRDELRRFVGCRDRCRCACQPPAHMATVSRYGVRMPSGATSRLGSGGARTNLKKMKGGLCA